MRDEVKNAIINKNSFLIYGYDHGYNIDIFNELLEGLESRYSEIFYFNMLNSSINPKFNLEVHRVAKGLNLFEFFNEKKISQLHFDRYIKDICNCLHAELFDTKVDGQTYLTNLLEAVYHSEHAKQFTMNAFIQLLHEIIEAKKSKLPMELLKALNEIEIVKRNNSQQYVSDPNFDKLAREARLEFERFLFKDPMEGQYLELSLKWSDYDSAVKYFIKLLEKIQSSQIDKFSNKAKTVLGKINYFQIDRYITRCNYLDMFLSNLVRKLIIYNSTNKPLIIISGKQKDLFKSVSMDVEELFQKCDVCFFINSDEDLDSKINHFVDVKIYSHKHKNLSLHPSGVEKRIENDYTVHY